MRGEGKGPDKIAGKLYLSFWTLTSKENSIFGLYAGQGSIVLSVGRRQSHRWTGMGIRQGRHW